MKKKKKKKSLSSLCNNFSVIVFFKIKAKLFSQNRYNSGELSHVVLDKLTQERQKFIISVIKFAVTHFSIFKC